MAVRKGICPYHGLKHRVLSRCPGSNGAHGNTWLLHGRTAGSRNLCRYSHWSGNRDRHKGRRFYRRCGHPLSDPAQEVRHQCIPVSLCTGLRDPGNAAHHFIRRGSALRHSSDRDLYPGAG